MRRLLSHITHSLTFIGLALFIVDLALAQEQTFTLSGVVVNDAGSPIRRVEVTLKGDGIEQRTFTDDGGKFTFELPAGNYELVFRRRTYYETVLRDVEISKQPLSTLKIILPRLTFERDLEIIGHPKIVPAPALEVTFKPKPPLKIGHPIRGTLLLKNVGTEPILIPTEPYTKKSQYSPEVKIMWLTVDVEGFYAFYSQSYICLPSKSCKELGPSEEISFQVTIYHSEGYYEGKRVVQVYPKLGEYKLKARVYFVLPSPPGENIYTEGIEKEVTVLVCDCPGDSNR